MGEGQNNLLKNLIAETNQSMLQPEEIPGGKLFFAHQFISFCRIIQYVLVFLEFFWTESARESKAEDRILLSAVEKHVFFTDSEVATGQGKEKKRNCHRNKRRDVARVRRVTAWGQMRADAGGGSGPCSRFHGRDLAAG